MKFKIYLLLKDFIFISDQPSFKVARCFEKCRKIIFTPQFRVPLQSLLLLLSSKMAQLATKLSMSVLKQKSNLSVIAATHGCTTIHYSNSTITTLLRLVL